MGLRLTRVVVAVEVGAVAGQGRVVEQRGVRVPRGQFRMVTDVTSTKNSDNRVRECMTFNKKME